MIFLEPTKSDHLRLAQSSSGWDSFTCCDRPNLPLWHRWYVAWAGLVRRAYHRSGRLPEGLLGTRARGGDYDTGRPQKEVSFSKDLRENEAGVF